MTWEDIIQNAGGERWTRMCMGMRHSHYVCTQGSHRAEEVVRANHWDTTNTFNWESVSLNLLGKDCIGYTRLIKKEKLLQIYSPM